MAGRFLRGRPFFIVSHSYPPLFYHFLMGILIEQTILQWELAISTFRFLKWITFIFHQKN